MSMKMTMAEFVGLKPCPFCGGEAYTLSQAPNGTGYSVGCHDDECRGFIALSWIYKTEAEAIAAWNTRHERMCHVAKVTRTLRSMLHGEQEVIDEECSECGGYMDVGFGVIRNYCPNCGAKVIKEVDNADK